MEIEKNFSKRLMFYREKAGLSRKELAYEAGVRPETITSYETYPDKYPRMLYRYYELARALKIEMSCLISEEEIDEFSFASKLNHYRQVKRISVKDFCKKTDITEDQLANYESIRTNRNNSIPSKVVDKFAAVLGISSSKLQAKTEVDFKYMTRGEIIKHYRLMNGFKQSDVAFRVCVSSRYLTMLETDEIHDNLDKMKILRIAEELKIPMHLIFKDKSVYDKENWTFAQRLRYYRAMFGYSQDELVKNAHCICTRYNLTDYEVHGVVPHINVIAVLAGALGIPVHYLSDAPDVGENLFSIMKI